MDQMTHESFSFVTGFDQQLDALFGGRESELGVKVFSEFGEVFIGSVDTRIGQLTEALKNSDFKQVQHMAHQLRGSFRTLGAHPLADNCQLIEDHCKKEASPNGQFIAPIEESIRTAIPRLKNELKQYLDNLPLQAS